MAVKTETPVLDLIAKMTKDSIEASTLDARELMLVRIAALVAIDAPPASYLLNLGAASEIGIEAEEVRGVLLALAPIVGTPAHRQGGGEHRSRARNRDRARGAGGVRDRGIEGPGTGALRAPLCAGSEVQRGVVTAASRAHTVQRSRAALLHFERMRASSERSSRPKDLLENTHVSPRRHRRDASQSTAEGGLRTSGSSLVLSSSRASLVSDSLYRNALLLMASTGRSGTSRTTRPSGSRCRTRPITPRSLRPHILGSSRQIRPQWCSPALRRRRAATERTSMRSPSLRPSIRGEQGASLMPGAIIPTTSSAGPPARVPTPDGIRCSARRRAFALSCRPTGTDGNSCGEPRPVCPRRAVPSASCSPSSCRRRASAKRPDFGPSIRGQVSCSSIQRATPGSQEVRIRSPTRDCFAEISRQNQP